MSFAFFYNFKGIFEIVVLRSPFLNIWLYRFENYTPYFISILYYYIALVQF